MNPLSYSRSAFKTLRKMPRDTAERIKGKVDQYPADPASRPCNAKALQGREGIRLRVGEWRVIMRNGEVLAVLEIGSRGSICGA